MQDEVAQLVFEVPGNPRGKGRHRSFVDAKKGRVVHVAERETVSYEAQVKWFARQAMGACGLHEPLSGPLWMQLTVFTKPNKDQAKAMAQAPHRPHYATVKPDADNVLKAICDALNGIAYPDDASVADARVVKRLDANTRVVVSIGRLA